MWRIITVVKEHLKRPQPLSQISSDLERMCTIQKKVLEKKDDSVDQPVANNMSTYPDAYMKY